MRNNKNIFKHLEETLSGDLCTDLLTRYMLSTDGSIFRVEPTAVAYPKNKNDIKTIVEFGKTHDFPLHARGAGSGLCGSALGKGIVIDFTKYMNRLLAIDLDNQFFECQPGYRLGELESQLKGTGLFFPPDPSSGEYATFGGMYSTNASGAHSVKYGNVADYIIDAEVVLSSGKTVILSQVMSSPIQTLPGNLKALYSLYETNAEKIETAYPDTPFNTAGYNLRGLVSKGRLNLMHLFAGAEGTLGVVTKLKFRLKNRPAYDSLLVAYMNDIVSSARAVQKILPLGPSGIEIMDKSLLQLALSKDARLRDKFPEGIDNILLIEFDSFDPDTCTKTAQKVKTLLQGQGEGAKITLAVSAEEKSRLWAIRKAAVPILYKLKGRKKILALIEDAAVPIENLVKYFASVYSLLNNYKVNFVVYGHIAKGLLHTRPLLDLKDPKDVDLLKPLADDFYDMVSDLDGTVSGEHGDGRLRSAYIRRRFPDIYDLFLGIKHLLDPDNLMNPEIITHHDPGQMKKSLRFGENYHSQEPSRSLISWSDTFSNEVEKCHGCSQCTTVTSATRMCPVYKITREEAASPKAKANILRAIISGRIQNKEIYEYSFQHVIKHCFYCDSCAFECPSNVNIPKMALEARARYVRRYGTSIHNHMISRVEMAGRTTRKFSPILKPIMALTPVKKLGERFAELSADRDFIAFSPRSLSEQIPVQTGQGIQKVLYFAGCYASYIQPAIGLAAVNILKRLNFTVLTPEQHCCGLPMLSKGMVPAARSKIKDNLKRWGYLIDEVDAIVVTCSSCGLSLMQEWEYLLENKMVERIKNKTIHISRMITEKQQSLKFKPADLNVVYHYPCHLKVQPDPDSSVTMLNAIKGVRVEALQTNCCGIAGSWGLAAKNFRLSKQIGQDMLDKLAASGAAVGVTDCPTCRIQMEQFSEKLIRHPIEIFAHFMEK